MADIISLKALISKKGIFEAVRDQENKLGEHFPDALTCSFVNHLFSVAVNARTNTAPIPDEPSP